MKKVTSLLICLIALAMVQPAQAQEGKRKKKKEEVTTPVKPPAPKKEEKAFKEISEVTKSCHKEEGLFTIYQDTTTGKTYMEISEDQIGNEFIYFKHVLDGVLDARYFRGAYRDNKIFKVARYYDKIEFREQSTRFYFNPESALSKASNVNVNEPIVFSAKIEAVSKDTGDVAVTRYLIPSDAMFLSETINQVKPSNPPGVSASKMFNLGKLSKTKTKYSDIRNYPENTDVIVEYAFENPYPSVSGGEAITNSRYVTLTVQHSLIAIPDNDFKPRYEDSRIGYFISKTTDLTSMSATPYRDVIKRWHLKKKDPNAELSEPVEPIVYWIENTTPYDIREIIMEAGMRWNEAFEAAGFKNALVIKQQPDDADWDAGDMRYNVLRWTSSPTPPFGGYGPSFINPRTGQILGADIMLEFIVLANRLKFEKVFDRAGMVMEEEKEIMDAFWPDHEDDLYTCDAGLYAQNENMFANYVSSALGLEDADKSKILKQGITRLILHEMGHTLGLAHNFCASQSMGIEEAHNTELTDRIGLTASVMDYHATNIAVNKEDQGDYTISQPGIYDEWAIEYGYREFADEEAEREGLAKILARSTEDGFCYGNDADDMRSPGKGTDPRINVSDLTSDAIGFSITRMELVKKSLPKLMDNMLEEGGSYHEFRNGYLVLSGNYAGALNVITRYVGGVYIDRSRVGQETKNKPLTPVPLEVQKRAMNTLSRYAFAPDAFDIDEEILVHLKMQRRGWDLRGAGEDPRIHNRVLNMQKGVLSHILHPNVLTRLTDSQLYGNEYSVTDMMSDLTSAIFDADLYTSVNSFRQHLQMDYVSRLGNIMTKTPGNNSSTKSAALYQLNKIKSMVSKAKSPDESTKAHRMHVVYSIDKALDTDN